MCPKNYACYSLAPFGPFLKSLPEVQLKSLGLIPLVEEIPKQPSIDRCVVASIHFYEDL